MNHNTTAAGQTSWESPSNIALIKYWGKYGIQLPRNPSISITLKNAVTRTTVNYSPKKENTPSIEIYFEGKLTPSFLPKINTFLSRVDHLVPEIKELDLSISSENTFPHSTGIASSASGMSALALCIATIYKKSIKPDISEEEFYQLASEMARLGSGSACRSVYPDLAIWGECNGTNGSNNFAVPYDEIHPSFKGIKDSIAIISAKEKSVSSTAGHQLMENNPYATTRFKQAEIDLQEILQFIKNGDITAFGELIEREALTLHALMMTSTPSFILLEPNTLEAINRIHKYRKETSCPIYFTIDAGPNLHIIYPASVADEAKAFIQKEISPLCDNGLILWDEMGQGPRELEF